MDDSAKARGAPTERMTLTRIPTRRGVHGFALDPDLGEFILRASSMSIPTGAIPTRGGLAPSAPAGRIEEQAAGRYGGDRRRAQARAGEALGGRPATSLVAEAHRVLVRGGLCLCMRHREHPREARSVHLLCEANPVALVIEQAGGRARSGRQRVLEHTPSRLDERVALAFGSRERVERLVGQQRERHEAGHDAPLFGARGLFRQPV